MGTHVTSVTHHVLLYVMLLHGSHVRDGWGLIQREPTIAFVSNHVFPYVDVPFKRRVFPMVPPRMQS
jgi:hypothetical protein